MPPELPVEEVQSADFAGVSAHSNQRGVRVRFAPSPTGFLHIGGFRTALFDFTSRTAAVLSATRVRR